MIIYYEFNINCIQLTKVNIYKIMNLYNKEPKYTSFKFIQIKLIARLDKTIAAN